MNPFDSHVDAMILTCELTASMNFELDDEFNLSGEAIDVQTKFVNIESYFKSAITAKKLNGQLSVIQPVFLAYVNTILDKGIALPIPKDISKFILNPRISTYNNYLFIDAQPDFTKFNDPKMLEDLTLSPWSIKNKLSQKKTLIM